MLSIKNLHAEVDGKHILKGLNLEVKGGEVHAIMGPNGAGKSTLGNIISGRDGYEVTEGSVEYKGKDLLEMDVAERAREGVFLAFQYPVEIAGVTNMYFLKAAVNAVRKHRGQEELNSMNFIKLVKEKAAEVEMKQEFLYRGVNEGFSGGEKKRNEILQMSLLEPSLGVLDETDSGLDIDALRIVAEGVNRLRSEDRGIILVTHYQRLLDYIEPDFVHVLADGKIVQSGDKTLALELEEKGYGWIEKERRIMNNIRSIQQEQVQPYAEQYSALSSSLPGQNVDALSVFREQAMSAFRQQGFPTLRDEGWRFTPLTAFLKKGFALNLSSSETQTTYDESAVSVLLDSIEGLQSYRLVFIDGCYSSVHSTVAQIDGLSVNSIEEQVTSAADNVVNLFEPDSSANAFVALNNASLSQGAVISLDAGVELNKPLEIVFIGGAEKSWVQPRIVLQLAQKASMQIVERHISYSDVAYASNLVTQVSLEAEAKLDWCILQQQNKQSYHFHSVAITQAENSSVNTHTVSLGGALIRNELTVNQDGVNAFSALNGVYALSGKQHVDNHTSIKHNVEHGRSEELYKGVLDQRSRAVFCGHIYVEKDAQKIDSEQANNSLLLSPHAEVDTMPQLEIYADDVKCAHGATVGQLDQKSLFYLCSRGIDEKDARALLTFGFVNEVVERIELESVRQYVSQALQQQFLADL